MEIYVQSRSQQRDYYWLAKRDNQLEEDLGRNPHSIINTVNQIIEEQKFSVVVFRSQEKKLLLLVTGLPTKRQDSKDRNIRNSVAWIGENKDEPILRKIAALALQNQLEQKIDDVVDESSSGEFGVKWDGIQPSNLVSGVANELSLSTGEAKGKIARISDSRKQNLAEILTKHNLPAREGALVVVTSGKAKDTLESARVWRGLSDDPRISENWEDLHIANPSSNPQIAIPLKLVLVVAVIVIVIFGWYLVAPSPSWFARNNKPVAVNSPQPSFSPNNTFTSTPNAPQQLPSQGESTKATNESAKLCQGKKGNNKTLPNLSYSPNKYDDPNVRNLQEILKSLGIQINPDGNFGQGTKTAVKTFQKQYRELKDTGEVDAKTWEVLWKVTRQDNLLQTTNTFWDELCKSK